MPSLPPASAHSAARIRLARAVASFMQVTVIYRDVEYTQGAGATGPATLINREGGQFQGEQFTWRILKSLLPSPPAVDDTLTHNEQTWIVREISGLDEWAAEYILVCSH